MLDDEVPQASSLRTTQTLENELRNTHGSRGGDANDVSETSRRRFLSWMDNTFTGEEQGGGGMQGTENMRKTYRWGLRRLLCCLSVLGRRGEMGM
jgi:hypothetical protein